VLLKLKKTKTPMGGSGVRLQLATILTERSRHSRARQRKLDKPQKRRFIAKPHTRVSKKGNGGKKKPLFVGDGQREKKTQKQGKGDGIGGGAKCSGSRKGKNLIQEMDFLAGKQLGLGGSWKRRAESMLETRYWGGGGKGVEERGAGKKREKARSLRRPKTL